jgi:hypothetical protein
MSDERNWAAAADDDLSFVVIRRFRSRICSALLKLKNCSSGGLANRID